MPNYIPTTGKPRVKQNVITCFEKGLLCGLKFAAELSFNAYQAWTHMDECAGRSACDRKA